MKTKADFILEQWNYIDLYGLPMGYGDNRLVAVANRCKCSIEDVMHVLATDFERIVMGNDERIEE